MCVAAPGKVIGIEGTKAVVDFNGNIVNAEAGLVHINVGDDVLVHAGCIIQKLSPFDRDMLFEIIEELENI